MLDNNLKKIVFNFLRKKPEIICSTCKDICVWNKKITKKYIDIPVWDYSVIFHQCLECNWRSVTRELFN